MALLRRSGVGYSQIHTYCAQARLACALGDVEGTAQALGKAERALEAQPLWHMVLHLIACQVQLRLCSGDVETAARWAEGDPDLLKRPMPETLPTFLRETQQIALARVHLARGQPDRALAALAGLEEQARAAGRLAPAIESALLRALGWEAQGRRAAALAAIERALSPAEAAGYVRLFVEVGPDVVPLLRRAVAGGIRPAYAGELLAAAGTGDAGSAPVTRRAASQPLIDPLTPRELEVLRLICEGLSNHEIAGRLAVTLNTVKKHSSHIYSKLGVRSRTQAIGKAQELELL
jgi:LuxR family maltose regulon positive regulatory protein